MLGSVAWINGCVLGYEVMPNTQGKVEQLPRLSICIHRDGRLEPCTFAELCCS